jgi:hypothetical protein
MTKLECIKCMYQVKFCMSFLRNFSILHTHMLHALTTEMAKTSKIRFGGHQLHCCVGSPLYKVCSISWVVWQQHNNDTKGASSINEVLPSNAYTNYANCYCSFSLCYVKFNMWKPRGSNFIFCFFVLYAGYDG